MRDYKTELEQRIEYIRETVKSAGARGVVFGNSGGKDCALVGILCRKALGDDFRVVSVMLPCESRRNFESDLHDAELVCNKFGIERYTIDLTESKKLMEKGVETVCEITPAGRNNIAPRLRMTTLYTIGASLNLLVAGTGNRCERYMGYFTKWGDGACDFNPISDLFVSEVYEFLDFLDCPREIIEKAPSAGLFEGQTDEMEMGVSYAEIEAYIKGDKVDERAKEIIERYHRVSRHKLEPISTFENFKKS